MASTREMVTGTFRVDKSVKESAEVVLQDLGMNMSTAINVFLAQLVRERKMPFLPDATKQGELRPTSRLERALEESEKILTGEIQAKSYNSFGELLEDL